MSTATTLKRDFLSLNDLTPQELHAVLDRAHRMKRGEDTTQPLRGKSLAMIFLKSSTRTRVSFEVGTFELGGHALFMSQRSSQLGRGESIHDTAHVLSGMVHGIVIRTFGHDEVEEFARHASIPVVNALTDLLHPCQILADLQTMEEELEGPLESKRVAWIGDGNNVANSWINAAGLLGFELALACPEGYDPDPEVLAAAQAKAPVTLTRDPAEAAEGAHVITTDVFTSMGQEEEAQERLQAFQGFQVDDALMARAHAEGIFLHCLPAHRGEEVAASVIDGPRSRVFQEAENRLHAQKALLAELIR